MNLNDGAKAEQELRSAMESGDPETIAQAIVRNAWPLYNSHYTLAVEALHTLPTAVVERHPIVRMMHPLTAVMAQGAPHRFTPTALGDLRGLDADESTS